MGLTKNSTGINLIKKIKKKNSNNKIITLIGNPNVGKSTIFNALTGLNQHTGNWTGKTVSSATGNYTYKEETYDLIDLPGTYSLSSFSKEEEVSRDVISFERSDLTVIILDATLLERNLTLATQILGTNNNALICLNLMDEALKKGIKIDLNKLKEIYKVSIISICANNKKDIEKLKENIRICCKNKCTSNTIINYKKEIEDVIKKVKVNLDKEKPNPKNRFFAIKLLEKNEDFNKKIYDYLKLNSDAIKNIETIIDISLNYLKKHNIEDYSKEIILSIIKQNAEINRKVTKEKEFKISMFDKILTSRIFGIPIMLLFLGLILWITIVGANYPSNILSNVLFSVNNYISLLLIKINTPLIIHDIIINGVLKTLAWVVSVMLPPMAIFFPLFTFLEDCGFLPRIAFNLDKLFKKAKCHGKQALTMCMGLGCNACGVMGCRIIDSPRERLIAILTNSLVPCNGRFPSLIAIITMFLAVGSLSSFKAAIILTLTLIFSFIVTLLISRFLSSTLLKGMPSSFVLEMPSYRKPQIKKIIIRSVLDRTIFVLGRAISVAIPAGLIIWLMANLKINNNSILFYCINFLDPIGNILGIDGTILMAFILGFPANEIVIPIIIMSYLGTGSLTDYTSLMELKNLLINNGWTIVTAICTLVLMLFHFPCSTTIITIKKETNSKFWTFIAFILPTVVGLSLCFLINLIFKIL